MGLNMIWDFILECFLIVVELIQLFSLSYQEVFNNFGGENPEKACSKTCKQPYAARRRENICKIIRWEVPGIVCSQENYITPDRRGI